MSEILKVEHLVKKYNSGNECLTILDNLDMSVEKGEKYVILGKSGSGKSTLLNIISGLDVASSGTVCVNGKMVSSMSEKELTLFRQKDVGLIFQFHYLLKDFTALENIYLPAYMCGMSKKDALEKAKYLLDSVGLSDRGTHLPSQLSGGERQRVSVARSLINDPEIILADEPTGNLDPQNAVSVSSLLFDMADKFDKTLILVTHDLNIASRGDRIFQIENGLLLQRECDKNEF